MTYYDRSVELMLRHEFLHVISHCRIIVYGIVGRIAMISQILCQSALEYYCVLQWLTRAYTGLFKSLASALLQSPDNSLKHGRGRLTY